MTSDHLVRIKHQPQAFNHSTENSFTARNSPVEKMPSSARDLPRFKPRPRAAGKSAAQYNKNKLQNAKYIHGVTEIDRTKGTSVPWKHGEPQAVAPSLIVGEPKCRACYKKVQPCDCGQPLFETDVNVYWTEASGYWDLSLLAVRKCEEIAILEARRLGMKCVVLRSEHHNTATKFDRTGRKTGYIPADWHITLYLGDDIEKVLLQGHCYTFVGKNTAFPQSKLKEGYRTILEPHEIIERLTLQEAGPQAYWGINGSCGWIKPGEKQPVENIVEKPSVEKVDKKPSVE